MPKILPDKKKAVPLHSLSRKTHYPRRRNRQGPRRKGSDKKEFFEKINIKQKVVQEASEKSLG